MKKILLAFILLAACTPEDKVDPAKAATFVRYFNGGNSDEAQQVVQTGDGGFLILINTEIKTSELAASTYKIKLIKTDGYGNQIWQRFYPDFLSDSDAGFPDHGKNFKGNNLLTTSDGYVIAGEDIQNGSSKLMIIRVSAETLKRDRADHEVLYDWTTLNTSFNVEGVGVATNASGNYWVLGSIINSSTNKNMILSKFSGSAIDSLESYQFGAGQNTLASRLFLNDDKELNPKYAYWGGTVQKSSDNTSIRFVKVLTNKDTPGGIDFDLLLSNPLYKETGSDFCRYGGGFAVVGTTNQKGTVAGDQDIFFKRIAEDGTLLSTQSFPIPDQQQNETGNSICATQDGGLLLLGTIDTQGSIGRGDKDYYLIKINAFGDVDWTQDYGSKFEDNGVNVIQSSDGGYVVLGTSSIGRVKTVMLMKTDKNGKIE